MGKLGMGFFWVASVPVVGIVAYVVGCSTDAQDFSNSGGGLAGQCPADDNPCTVEDCSTVSVKVTILKPGTVVDNGPVPECHQSICREVLGKTRPVDEFRELDTPCSAGVCNDAGACVSSCNDGRLNGDEKETDCGGVHCKGCNGMPCADSSFCVSGNCVDGVCCNKACTGDCESCATGECAFVPFNGESSKCVWPNACNGTGTCKIATGAPCDMKQGIDCVGVKCRGKCGPSQDCYNGSSCVINGGINECLGSKCLNAVNRPCNSDSDCDSNKCLPADAGSDASTCQ